jgi:hypothetical protein
MHVNRYRFSDPPPLAQVVAQRILSRPPRSLHPEEIAEAMRSVDEEADLKRTNDAKESQRDAPTRSDERPAQTQTPTPAPPQGEASGGGDSTPHIDVTV